MKAQSRQVRAGIVCPHCCQISEFSHGVFPRRGGQAADVLIAAIVTPSAWPAG